jgi:hypothetical protein
MRRSIGLILTLLLCSAGAAQASTISINAGAGLAANPAALAAFNRAADTLEALFSDPVVISINANLAVLGAGIIGSTNSTLLAGGFDLVRNAVVADGADEPDDTIVASLPTAAQFLGLVPAGGGLNGNIVLSQANAKALGFAVGAGPDATIVFSSAFAFDYDNSDGVGAGLVDFETVALHELVHALGFFSAVDLQDDVAPFANWVATLDLFRFRTSTLPTTAAEFTNFARVLAPGVASSFSDLTNTWAMSTGLVQGDGRQASHWKDDALTGIHIGVMDPTIANGVFFGMTAADIRALDLIGWDFVVATPAAVPEPASLILVGSGLVAVVRRRQGRRHSTN